METRTTRQNFGLVNSVHGVGLFCIVCGLLATGSSAVADQPAFVESVKLVASDADPQDLFGLAVALDGDVAIVGASEDDDNGSTAGAAYVYRFDGMSWSEEQKLLASDGADSDSFGRGVAVHGDVAIIGAPFASVGGNSYGKAYIFRYDGSTWNEEQQLVSSDPAFLGLFGLAVDIDGDVAVLGAYRNDRAYVYRFNGTTWSEEQILQASSTQEGDEFGWSVSLAGERVLVGAPRARSNDGAAYEFGFTGTSWAQRATLFASDGTPFDAFGSSVSFDGTRALVGASRDSDVEPVAGSLYAFEYDGTNWAETQKLTRTPSMVAQEFGHVVDFEGDTAIVGTAQSSELGVGSVFVYRHDGSSWTASQSFEAGDGSDSDYFGYALTVSGDRLLVGSAGADAANENSGAAYVIENFRCFDGTALRRAGPGSLSCTRISDDRSRRPKSFCLRASARRASRS